MAVFKAIIRLGLALSLKEALRGVRLRHGGPFGSVIIKDGRIIGVGHNTVIRDDDPTAHAEINAIRQAAKKLGLERLRGAILMASSEPCPLCLAAAYWSGIKEIHYCLPKEVAGRHGFRDAFIYAELKRAGEKRRIKMIKRPELDKKARTIFAEWKNAGGKPY